jgi:hypothetical protein
MPYANAEDRRKNAREWYLANRERVLKAQRDRYQGDPEFAQAKRDRTEAWREPRKDQINADLRQRRRIYRAPERSLAPWLAQSPELYQGDPAENPMKCKHGHPLDDLNMSFYPGSHLRCLTCQRILNRTRTPRTDKRRGRRR